MESKVVRYPTRTAVRERNRDALLRTASEVSAENGYHRTSVDEIARRAGLTKGAIYSIFGSKAALFAAVLQPRRDQFALSSIATAGTPLREALGEVGRFWARFVESPETRAHLILGFELGLDVLRQSTDADHVAGLSREVVSRFADDLEVFARAAGEDLSRPAHEVAVAVLAAVQGLGILHVMGVASVTEEQFIRAAEGALT